MMVGEGRGSCRCPCRQGCAGSPGCRNEGEAPKVVRRHEAQSPTRRRRKDKNNAWANEDAEDIQEDFDIQGSLRLFDKSTVFSEIRESDMTDPETLLVSHNRLKPATTATVGSSVPAMLQRLYIIPILLSSNSTSFGVTTTTTSLVNLNLASVNPFLTLP
ncbi:hypothetical protein BC829DRAFT_137157 [Chytridium lagenaria]|nr:hypothetical protein BC829DRAFT_137157 [Chytridium lagenaria]